MRRPADLLQVKKCPDFSIFSSTAGASRPEKQEHERETPDAPTGVQPAQFKPEARGQKAKLLKMSIGCIESSMYTK
jgi:hypothetical protein